MPRKSHKKRLPQCQSPPARGSTRLATAKGEAEPVSRLRRLIHRRHRIHEMAFVVIGALAVLGGAFVWGPSGKVAAVWKILVEFPFALVRMVWRLLSRRPTVLDRAILLWFCLMALSFFGSRYLLRRELCQLGHHESGDGAGKDAELIGIEIIPADLSAPETPPQEAEPPVFARGLQVPSPGMGVVLCLLEANQPSMNPQNALRLGTAARRRKAKHYRRMLVEAISF